MRKERRKIKHIKLDLARSYSGMEAKVDSRAKEVFKRKTVFGGPCLKARDRRIHKAASVYDLLRGQRRKRRRLFLAVELILQFLMAACGGKSRQ